MMRGRAAAERHLGLQRDGTACSSDVLFRPGPHAPRGGRKSSRRNRREGAPRRRSVSMQNRAPFRRLACRVVARALHRKRARRCLRRRHLHVRESEEAAERRTAYDPRSGSVCTASPSAEVHHAGAASRAAFAGRGFASVSSLERKRVKRRLEPPSPSVLVLKIALRWTDSPSLSESGMFSFRAVLSMRGCGCYPSAGLAKRSPDRRSDLPHARESRRSLPTHAADVRSVCRTTRAASRAHQGRRSPRQESGAGLFFRSTSC